MTPYDIMHGISELLAAVLWPALVAGLLIAYHKPLSAFLLNVRKVSVGPFSAEVDAGLAKTSAALVQLSTSQAMERTAEAEKRLSETANALRDALNQSRQKQRRFEETPLRVRFASNADTNPKNAMLEAYLQLERWFDYALTSHGIDTMKQGQKLGVPQMALIAVDHGMIPQNALAPISQTTYLRDLILDQPGDKVSSQQAREYLSLMDGIIFTLSAQFAEWEETHPRTAEPFSWVT